MEAKTTTGHEVCAPVQTDTRRAKQDKVLREDAGAGAMSVEARTTRGACNSPQIAEPYPKALSWLRTSPGRVSVLAMDRTHAKDGALVERTGRDRAKVGVTDAVQRDG